MNLEAVLGLAQEGKLYPSVILHGGDEETRREAAIRIARTLLCQAPVPERPCGDCRHCRRIVWSPGEEPAFHPDVQILGRDLKTATSVAATREILKGAQLSPFEARGQVFLIASAESLTPEAANALLKTLEEPPVSAPRHFLLLAPTNQDLLPTIRSRSLAVYLGPVETVDDDEVAPLADRFASCLTAYANQRAAVYLLAAAGALRAAGGWEDPRASRSWIMAARAVLRAREQGALPPDLRRRCLDLAQALLEAPTLRLRAIPPERILEGLVVRYLEGAS